MSRRRPYSGPPCEECGGSHPRKRHRLNPRNLRSEYRLLCDSCGTKLGFRLVSYDRSPANFATASTAGRRGLPG